MKTKLLFLLLLLFSGALHAQILNIPDPVFKNLLLNADVLSSVQVVRSGGGENIDQNNDNEIQVSEALAVTSIGIIEPIGGLNSLEGIKAFSNLQILNIKSLTLPSLDISEMTSLVTVHLGDIIGTANLTGCSSIQTIFSGDYDATDDYNIDTLNCTGLTSLVNFFAATPVINHLNFTGCSALQTLNLYWGGIGEINLAGCTGLKNFSSTGNPFTIVDLTSCTGLEKIDFIFNYGLEQIILGTHLNLEEIEITDGITDIDVSGCPNLTSLELDCNLLTALDLSQNPIIDELFLSCPALNNLNLKNGKATYSDFTADINVTSYICIDEGEQSYLTGSVFTSANINTYCSFTPGGPYNNITGSLTLDLDNNGCDSGDAVLKNTMLKRTEGSNIGYTFSNTAGGYNFFVPAGSFSIQPILENNFFTVTPASATINFANNNNNTILQNFCISPDGVHPDVEVLIIPGWSQPGFDATYRLLIKNKGNQVLSGDVTFAFDDAVHDYVSADPMPASVGTGTATWGYTSLLPFETRTMNIVLNANGPMETPPLNNGDFVTFSAAVTPATGDETPADNVFTVTNELLGSYDPNDITCLEGDLVHPEKIGGYLHYNINFENTGTAPATFIVVRQDINAADFDISTLEVMHSSHNMDVRITGKKVEYIFNNIGLPAEGKGNIVYKIKSKSTLQAGDDVTASANIYFDYNWPVITNNATTIFEVLSTGNFIKDNSVVLYPNPSNGLVSVKADAEVKSIELYDLKGRLVQSVLGNKTIDISQHAKGIYIVKATTEKGTKVEKLIKE